MELNFSDYAIITFFVISLFFLIHLILLRIKVKALKNVYELDYVFKEIIKENQILEINKELFFYKNYWFYQGVIRQQGENGFPSETEIMKLNIKSRKKIFEENLIHKTGTLSYLKCKTLLKTT